jgi:hypothetical protein
MEGRQHPSLDVNISAFSVRNATISVIDHDISVRRNLFANMGLRISLVLQMMTCRVGAQIIVSIIHVEVSKRFNPILGGIYKDIQHRFPAIRAITDPSGIIRAIADVIANADPSPFTFFVFRVNTSAIFLPNDPFTDWNLSRPSDIIIVLSD